MAAIVTGALICLFALVGLIKLELSRSSRESKPTVLRPGSASEDEYDFTVVTTKGNHSYIPLELYGDPSEHAKKILDVLSAFEKKHPQLEVKDWRIEKRGLHILGIWVDHRRTSSF